MKDQETKEMACYKYRQINKRERQVSFMSLIKVTFLNILAVVSKYNQSVSFMHNHDDICN